MSNLRTSLFRLTAPRRIRQFSELPGPTPRFPLGNATHFLGCQPWEACADLGREHGPIFVIWVLNRPFVVLNDGNLVREVLDTHSGDYYKADPVPAFRPLTPRDSLFLANGSEWQRLRKFHPYSLVDQGQFLADQIPVVRELIRARAADLVRRTATCSLKLTETLQRVTFDAFSLCLWGKQLENQTYTDFNTLGNVGARRVSNPPLAAIPPFSPWFYAARKRWGRTFDGLIEQAGEDTSAKHTDLLHRAWPKNRELSPAAFRVLLATMFYGGVYSATSGVVSTLYSLSRHRDIADRVRDEVRALMPGSATIDPEALDNCRYLDAALREALRLLPPVPIFLRNVNKQHAVELGGYTIPPNTPVIITTWALHRSADHWEAAEQYQPERWLEGATESNPLGSDHFFPFGRGPRACIGESFAMLSMKLVLATLLAETDVQITGDYRQSFYFGVMLPRGLQAKFVARR